MGLCFGSWPSLTCVSVCVFPELKDGVYTVKFDSLLLKKAELEADGVIPPMRTDSPVSSESHADTDIVFAKGLCVCVCVCVYVCVCVSVSVSVSVSVCVC